MEEWVVEKTSAIRNISQQCYDNNYKMVHVSFLNTQGQLPFLAEISQTVMEV